VVSVTDAPEASARTATTGTPRDGRRTYRRLAWAVGALIVAVVLAATFPAWQFKVPYGVMLTSTYLLTWGPLVIALVATALFWRQFVRFRPIDIYLGIMAGAVARAVGIIVQFLGTGRMPSSDLMLGGISGVYIFTTLIAPIIIAPVVEEPFFRGLLQGSLDRVLRPWGSLIVTAVVFTLVHTIADGWSWMLIVTLLVFALLTGYVTQRTKRLAPAIIGHAVFNGLAALIAWPW
jgi:membrane protease YdiL (CAAX protease family)